MGNSLPPKPVVTARHQVLEDSGILSCVVSYPFPQGALDDKDLTPEKFSIMDPAPYQVISLSSLALLEVEAPMSISPRHMEVSTE